MNITSTLKRNQTGSSLNKGWIFLTIVMLLTTDLLVVNLFGYPVVLTFTLLPIWLFKSFVIKGTVRVKIVLFFLALVAIPLINIGDVTRWVEFIKAYALLIMNATILLFFCYSRSHKVNQQSVFKAVKLTQAILLIYSLMQVFELKFIGTKFLWGIWGNFSATHIIPTWGMRAKAFYHEPSHLALISIFIFWMRFICEQKLKLVNLFSTTILLLLTMSGAGLLLFPVIVLYIVVTRYKWFIIFPTLAIMSLPIAFVIQSNAQILSKELKIDQVQNTEAISSGYMRWVLPIKILKSHLNEGRYFGYGLGQLEREYFLKVDKLFRQIDVKENAIANGLLSAQIQLGIFFTIFIIYAFFYKYPRMDKNWRSFIFINFVCLTAGSYFMVEMYFIRFFIPILLLKSISKK